ncbi:hypothetical protein J5N97_007640 [Dioscorea zingiberensis]|uniref:Uncharacterized protein n=1 Tax=Dioscorea zingiberensis TaxID=325984 RepID=A0A9D5HUF3_9LILI|nr:hypothetical protein J5N97_007640 [Dioscorea zingiberensis]
MVREKRLEGFQRSALVPSVEPPLLPVRIIFLELFVMIPAPFSSGIAPQFQVMPPLQSAVSSFWQSENVHEHARSLRETIDLLQAMEKELEGVHLMRSLSGNDPEGDVMQGMHLQLFETIKAKRIGLDIQESLSLEAAKSLFFSLKNQLLPFSVVAGGVAPWEERSAAVKLTQKLQKYKRNKQWKKKKRKRVSEMLRKECENYDKADKEADEWRAREIAKDIAKQKVEDMKAIAKLKANEEKKKLESELELILVVEKLQELRSIRIQKLKKEGHFLPEEDDKFLERVRAAVEEEERQTAAASETCAAKDAIATAEGSRKVIRNTCAEAKDIKHDRGNTTATHDRFDAMGSEGNSDVDANMDPAPEENLRQKLSGGYDSVANLPSEFYHYYHGSSNDMGTLIEVRRMWDVYIRPGGSHLLLQMRSGHLIFLPGPSEYLTQMKIYNCDHTCGENHADNNQVRKLRMLTSWRSTRWWTARPLLRLEREREIEGGVEDHFVGDLIKSSKHNHCVRGLIKRESTVNHCAQMEKKEYGKHSDPQEFPSLIKYITSKSILGFDTTQNPQLDTVFVDGSEHADSDRHENLAGQHHHSRSVSISLPASPSGFQAERAKRILITDNGDKNTSINGLPEDSTNFPANSEQKKHAKFHSQPMPLGSSCNTATLEVQSKTPRQNRLKDKRFDSFKTFSGKLERQISNLRGIPQLPVVEDVSVSEITDANNVPAVGRYFDALQGPELDTLKASEESVLPEDKKWPFLLRFPVSSFGICLGVSSQAILWKTLATSPSTSFLHVSLTVNLVLWSISIALMGIVSFIYILKIIFYFEAVRREYYHPIRVNFFFAPWIACLFITIGLPPSVAVNLHSSLWYILMVPILCLELKIYGQWLSGGQRQLSKVANPSNHLSIVGNFVGALLGASMGLKEGPIFFFAVGLAHYIVLFVTLYQRLPTNETLPKELHPVFFLFVAAPSVACMAWAKINDHFDYGSRITYFIALFSLAWWAYTFPMTGASIATIRYATEVKNVFTQTLSVALSSISTITVAALLVSTLIHAFVLHDLFPNDISIAIAYRKQKSSKKHTNLKAANSDAENIEACLSEEIDASSH